MSAKADSKGNRKERFICNVARNRSAPVAAYCEMGSGVVRYRLEDAFAELLGAELVGLEKTAAFVTDFNQSLAAGPRDVEEEKKKIERQLADISRKVMKTWDEVLTVEMAPHWIADIRKKLQVEEEFLLERLSALNVPAAEPLKLAPEKSEVLLSALSGLISMDRVDTSTEEGAELIASLHERVEAVLLDVFKDGSFTMRIVVRPHTMLGQPGEAAHQGRVVLEKKFAKAVRGYFGSPRFAQDIAVRLLEERHCLSDEQWETVRHLVPSRVGASSRRPSGTVLDRKTVVEAALFHL
jgi:hypothetical protein